MRVVLIRTRSLKLGHYPLFGLYRFGDSTIRWSDVPMEPQRWAAPPTGEQVPIAFALVDAASGIVRALRLVLLPVGFCAALAEAVGRTRGADPQRHAADVAAAMASFSSEEMAKIAPHVAEHGPKGPAPRA